MNRLMLLVIVFLSIKAGHSATHNMTEQDSLYCTQRCQTDILGVTRCVLDCY